MYKLISLSYYFNILEVGFVVLGGLMLVGMILKQQKGWDNRAKLRMGIYY
ncbi:hypothetical protein [Bacillus cereus]|nr:hypothetical protein [Bacillus cereus]